MLKTYNWRYYTIVHTRRLDQSWHFYELNDQVNAHNHINQASQPPIPNHQTCAQAASSPFQPRISSTSSQLRRHQIPDPVLTIATEISSPINADDPRSISHHRRSSRPNFFFGHSSSQPPPSTHNSSPFPSLILKIDELSLYSVACSLPWR
ncbi:hypothetical protein M0R45_026882 [Rubus argutus]|uniref:Uncharacterized protein n=1 Tax=Rubus argutus TaxID=59490 RepID=A0AAW1WZ86_RUBAR